MAQRQSVWRKPGVDVAAGVEDLADVGVDQFLALRGGQRHVGIVNERGEVVMREAGTEALEIDEPGFAAIHEDVLGLEIAVHEDARFFSQQTGDGVELCGIGAGSIGDAEKAGGAVIEKIILLPEVELLVELRLELERGFAEGAHAARVKRGHFIEGEAVIGAKRLPAGIAEGPEIGFAEIFHPDEAFLLVVVKNLRDVDAEGGEEAGDVAVMAVFLAAFAIADEDEGVVVGDADAVVLAVGAALFQFVDVDLALRVAGEAGDGLCDQVFGQHQE